MIKSQMVMSALSHDNMTFANWMRLIGQLSRHLCEDKIRGLCYFDVNSCRFLGTRRRCQIFLSTQPNLGRPSHRHINIRLLKQPQAYPEV